MSVRLALSILILGLSSISFGQTCVRSLNLSSPCSDGQFKVAAVTCNYGSATIGSSTSACQSPSAFSVSATSACSTKCAPPPPQFTSSFTSTLVSAQQDASNANLVKLTWVHNTKDSNCVTLSVAEVAIVDKSNAKNAAYLAAVVPAPLSSTSKYNAIRLLCPSSLWVTTKDSAGNQTVTYPAGCNVDYYSSTSAPVMMCIMQ